MLEIVCEKNLFFSDAGSFSCTLYWRTEEGAFPAEGWTDFAGVLLKWWTDAYFCLNGSTAAEFLFMDGPYRIRAVREGESVRCAFLRDEIRILPDQSMELDELRAALICAVRRLKSGLSQADRKADAEQAGELLNRLKIVSG